MTLYILMQKVIIVLLDLLMNEGNYLVIGKNSFI